MDCLEFGTKINDFLFDKIEYSQDLEEFLEHAKNCKACNEELNLYYNIFRSLGDLDAPSDSKEVKQSTEELQDILEFYDDYFNKQKTMRKAGKISIFVFGIMVICTFLYIYLRMSNFFN